MYSSYTAAVFPRKLDLARKHGIQLEGALTWAFQFEDQPWFAGFRVLASNGVTLPVFNVFRMLSQMSGDRLDVRSSGDAGVEAILRDGVRGRPDVSALAARDGQRVTVMIWHYHDDDLPGPPAQVALEIGGLSPSAKLKPVRHFRIDDQHSNAFEAWKRMGKPLTTTAAQYAELEQAGELAQVTVPECRLAQGVLTSTLLLPRQGVSLLVFDAE
jgi:xylan 1,4-beta-xylosidase